jgi:hypothetical protein
LAYAFHCGNEADGIVYEHKRCIAGYMSGAIGFYRFRHIERGMGMVLKSVGLPPRGRLSRVVARLAWMLMCRRKRSFDRVIGKKALLF